MSTPTVYKELIEELKQLVKEQLKILALGLELNKGNLYFSHHPLNLIVVYINGVDLYVCTLFHSAVIIKRNLIFEIKLIMMENDIQVFEYTENYNINTESPDGVYLLNDGTYGVSKDIIKYTYMK
jgi:hypothetical protein